MKSFELKENRHTSRSPKLDRQIAVLLIFIGHFDGAVAYSIALHTGQRIKGAQDPFTSHWEAYQGFLTEVYTFTILSTYVEMNLGINKGQKRANPMPKGWMPSARLT